MFNQVNSSSRLELLTAPAAVAILQSVTPLLAWDWHFSPVIPSELSEALRAYGICSLPSCFVGYWPESSTTRLSLGEVIETAS